MNVPGTPLCDAGAAQTRAAEQGQPRSEGCVPLPAVRSATGAQGDASSHLNQMKVMTMNSGISTQPDQAM
ncbi:hypothetical protein GCM10023090_12820 [Acidovorax lacteus]|uniref:Uncharacterized protein n=1 Tax=Acidovorax lacteus TaxID=1924988 RepID=A0ABP8L5Z2_9BURK